MPQRDKVSTFIQYRTFWRGRIVNIQRIWVLILDNCNIDNSGQKNHSHNPYTRESYRREIPNTSNSSVYRSVITNLGTKIMKLNIKLAALETHSINSLNQKMTYGLVVNA